MVQCNGVEFMVVADSGKDPSYLQEEMIGDKVYITPSCGLEYYLKLAVKKNFAGEYPCRHIIVKAFIDGVDVGGGCVDLVPDGNVPRNNFFATNLFYFPSHANGERRAFEFQSVDRLRPNEISDTKIYINEQLGTLRLKIWEAKHEFARRAKCVSRLDFEHENPTTDEEDEEGPLDNTIFYNSGRIHGMKTVPGRILREKCRTDRDIEAIDQHSMMREYEKHDRIERVNDEPFADLTIHYESRERVALLKQQHFQQQQSLRQSAVPSSRRAGQAKSSTTLSVTDNRRKTISVFPEAAATTLAPPSLPIVSKSVPYVDFFLKSSQAHNFSWRGSDTDRVSKKRAVYDAEYENKLRQHARRVKRDETLAVLSKAQERLQAKQHQSVVFGEDEDTDEEEEENDHSERESSTSADEGAEDDKDMWNDVSIDNSNSEAAAAAQAIREAKVSLFSTAAAGPESTRGLAKMRRITY